MGLQCIRSTTVRKRGRLDLFSWEGGKFLDSDPHWLKRKIKETLYINTFKAKGVNLMNLEGGIQVSSCWAAVGDFIMRKRRERLRLG
jgi:hypothetical protein